MTHVFHRQAGKAPPLAVGGEGIYLVDAAGRRYLDASGGAAVSCLGHGDAVVGQAIVDQVSRLAFAHTGFFTSEPAEALAAFLSAQAPGDMGWVYFTSGGSEAVESAMKLARQYFVENGEPQRRRFIARRRSYHGNTLGALAVGHHSGRRGAFTPLLIDVTHVSPCYAYREQQVAETDEAYAIRLANELEAAILASGPDTVCAFVAETMSGASLGAVPPVPGYFEKIRAVCDRYGVLLILDEVMCGMGRTGTLFAHETEGIAADMVCVAKGLAAGYQALGAVLVRNGIHQAFADGSGAFSGGHTYNGHPIGCAAALAVQQSIQSRHLLGNVQSRGRDLMAALKARFGNHPFIGDIRGRGLFVGLEVVADRLTKTPFAPERKLAARIKAHAMENGLICYPGSGCVDGVSGDHVLLAPPFILSPDQVDELVEKLSRALDGALLGGGHHE